MGIADVKKGRGLGRGLSALISSAPVPVAPAAGQAMEHEPAIAAPRLSNQDTVQKSSELSGAPAISYQPIVAIRANPKQPRQHFEESEIAELTESIRRSGVLQPILVRPSPVEDAQQRFEIVAGERRWRAAQRAELTQVPVIIKPLTDQEALELALVENVQRAGLTPVEEAKAYSRLMTEFALTQSEVADRVGKDRVTVANTLRLLRLSDDILQMIEKGELSSGHAKAILAIRDPSAQRRLAQKAHAEGLSVRALEALVARAAVLDGGRRLKLKGADGDHQGDRATDTASGSSQFSETADRLRRALGTKVILKHHASGRGRLEIEYFSEAELDRIVERICSSR